MFSKSKYVFIGAGVSTVFAIIKMLDNGIKGSDILVIEKGKNPYDRKSNEVMNGFLGAGCFSDAKIIYGLNQGGELSKYVGDEKTLQLMDELKNTIRKFHPDQTKIVITGIAEEPDYIKKSGLTLKQNICEHIGTNYIREISKIIYEYFIKNEVHMMFNSIVEKATIKDNTIWVEHYEYNKTIYSEIEYEHLIIATGKSGMNFINGLIKEYNLPNEIKSVQIGVRFESDYKYFEKLAVQFHDFKLYKKYDDNISCRSFCTNNKAAYIAIEDVDGMKSFNGHGYRDEAHINGLTNFGILFEIKNVDNPLQYTQELVKKCQINDKALYYTPDNRKPTVDAEQIPIDKFYEIYGSLAYNTMDFIRLLNTTFDFGYNWIIYIPEIKYLTNEIKVNYNDLSLIQYPNVHIIGDALSARGISVSACQGIYLAESFIKHF